MRNEKSDVGVKWVSEEELEGIGKDYMPMNRFVMKAGACFEA